MLVYVAVIVINILAIIISYRTGYSMGNVSAYEDIVASFWEKEFKPDTENSPKI